MDKKMIRERLGSMQQLASVRPVRYTEGRAAGMTAYEVVNGPLRYSLMGDKCLDIAECSYKGVNLSFLAKPGLMGRNHFDTNGEEALRSIMGGLMFTCGLENICPPCTDDGIAYPMHGRLRSTPAEHLCANAFWQDEHYVLEVSGEMREAQLFGENMVLRRRISSVYSENIIRIRDEFENEGFEAQPFLLLYHINFGYPFLDEGTKIVLPAEKTSVRDKSTNPLDWREMGKPIQGAPEDVYIHELRARDNGETFAAIVNETFNIGVKISFNRLALPYFMQWKSLASGDYVIGLEPANSSVLGRLEQKKKGLPMLAPHETKAIGIDIEILDGKEALQRLYGSSLLQQK